MDWLASNYKEIVAALVSLGLVSGGWTWFHNWRARRRDERQAATALVARATNYKLHWINKHYDELNIPFNDQERIQWGGDPFEPILSTPALEAIGSRLSSKLRKDVFALQALSQKWKSDILVAYEYDTEDIDIIGPLAVAQLAISADDLLKALAREAQVGDPDTGHSITSILEKEAEWLKDRAEWNEAQEKANAEFWKHHASKQPE